MGNLFGKDNNDDKLNFRGLKTEKMSTTIPYLNKLKADARNLAQQLDVNNKNFTESENYDMYKLFEKNNNQQQNNNDDSSPFISSEMYKYLVKNYKTGSETSALNTEVNNYMNYNFSDTSALNTELQQNGGGMMTTEAFDLTATPSLDQQIHQYLNRSQRGGGDDSSSSSEEETLTMNSDGTPVMPEMIDDDELMAAKINESMDMSGGSDFSVDSYLSSSAHSDGVDSDTLTVGNAGGYMSDSVNTSDINMISVE